MSQQLKGKKCENLLVLGWKCYIETLPFIVKYNMKEYSKFKN